MSFIPEDFKEPTVSNYMKLQDGENLFRVLSPSMITGYESWETIKKDDGTETRRPKRTPMSQPFNIGEVEDPEAIKIFWAFVVYNYTDEKVQILEITQKSLRKGLQGLIDNKKWGDPHDYDITIIKVGKAKETRYDVMPNPKEPMDKIVLDAYENMTVNLKALYAGEDPFDKEQAVTANEVKLEDINI